MELTVEEFKKSIFDYEHAVFKGIKPTLVDIYTDWCTQCKMISAPLEQLAKKYADSVDIIKVNITTADDAADALEIQGVPTFLFFKPGKDNPYKMVGGTPTKIEEGLKALL